MSCTNARYEIDEVEDKACMQKYYAVGRAETANGDMIHSTYPATFVKDPSLALAAVKGKAKDGAVVVAVWVGNFDTDDDLRLLVGDKDVEKNSRIPNSMYHQWKNDWCEKRTKPKNARQRANDRIEKARMRQEEEARKRAEKEQAKKERENQYKLPYKYYYARAKE